MVGITPDTSVQESELRWFDLLPKRHSYDTNSSQIINKAVEDIRLHTQSEDTRRITLKYSGHFRNYNSNAKYTKDKIQINISSNWKDVDDEIKQGLIESFLVKIFKLRMEKTSSMKLYEDFMKGLSKYAKKHVHDPLLEQSFDRVNVQFFNNMIDKPNLVFAGPSFSKLGSYEYSTDTVRISEIFRNLEEDDKRFLDYVLYHELLHKKHSFNIKNGRHHAHTREFRADEQKFGKSIESELSKFILRKKKSSVSVKKSPLMKNLFRWL
jgi:pterin-4a-carbinolamine dehydratase